MRFLLCFSLFISSSMCFALDIPYSITKSVLPFSLAQMYPQGAGDYKSEDHPGAIYVIEAYFKNCPYCNDNAESVNELADYFMAQQKVQILDVGIDRSLADYTWWVNRHRPNHPVLKDDAKALIRKLNVSGYPTTTVIDCFGNVAYKTTGAWDIETTMMIKSVISRLLAEECR